MRSLLIIAIVFLSACVSQPLPEGFQDQDDFDTVAAAKTRISLGLTYLKNGNFTQAKYNLDKALQFAPRLADAHFSMAYYYQQVDETRLADSAYQKAMDLAPKNPDIANSYGAFLCQQGQYEKAKSYFLTAVNAVNYISTAETYENLALCSQSQGQLNDAITYLNTALNHQPGRAKSLLLLSQLYIELGQWQEAKDSLRRYERMARITPETLWMSIKIERALGNSKLVQGYGDMLISMYPGHNYTLEYIKNRDAFIHSQQAIKTNSAAKMQKQIKPNFSSAQTSQGTPPTPTDETPPAQEESELAAKPELPTESPKERAEAQDPPVLEDVESTPAERQSNQEQEFTENNIQSTGDEDKQVTDPSDADKTVAELEADNQTPTDRADDVIYHVVEKGENLYRISLRYNVKMQRLIEWNQLDKSGSIYVGKKLIVVDPETVE